METSTVPFRSTSYASWLKKVTKMAQMVVAILGGIMSVVLLIGFARSLWRKPPDKPGSSSSTGGLPPGGVG
jgi:hypothetical protein